jgi:hypothetical protein
MKNPPKGQMTTPANPGESRLMQWVSEHLSYSHDWCLIWPFGRLRDGYAGMGRQGKAIRVHRYICQQVNGLPPTPEHHAAHSCGKGHLGCVNPRHLSWKTPSDNFKEGEKHPRFKLNSVKVAEIRRVIGAEKVQVTARRFGVTEATIRKVQKGKLWPHGFKTHAGKPTRSALVELTSTKLDAP